MELDTTKLKQAGFRKTVSHDNCVVLDIGSGSFPRYIEVRPPGDDGSRMTAIWNGSLDLAVNDKVVCIEYSGNLIWRVQDKGGGDSGIDSHRVSKLWESNFGAVALEADANGNVTLNGTRTLTIPTDLIHGGDADTKIGFDTDKQVYTLGGKVLLQMTNTIQDLVEIGDVGGGGDVDINFNNFQMFLQGSNGNLSLNSALRTFRLNIGDHSSGNRIMVQNGEEFALGMVNGSGNKTAWMGATTDGDYQFSDQSGIRLVSVLNNGAIEIPEISAPGAGAVNTARLFARDDGGGDTELCVRFSAGLIQVIAPLEFGGISVEENSTQTSIVSSGVAVQVIIFDTNEAANGATPDHTNDHITVSKDGTYLVICSLTATSIAGPAAKFHFEAKKNNGTTHLSGIHADVDKAGGGNDTATVTMSGLVILSSGDTIELWVANETNTQNIIVEDANLAITMAGVNA